jgi:hypothetical protein
VKKASHELLIAKSASCVSFESFPTIHGDTIMCLGGYSHMWRMLLFLVLTVIQALLIKRWVHAETEERHEDNLLGFFTSEIE